MYCALHDLQRVTLFARSFLLQTVQIFLFDVFSVAYILHLVVFSTIMPDIIYHPADYASFLMYKYS